jgi:hypothetical protein
MPLGVGRIFVLFRAPLQRLVRKPLDPRIPPECDSLFWAFPVVSLADSLYHRLQVHYPFGDLCKSHPFQIPSS